MNAHVDVAVEAVSQVFLLAVASALQIEEGDPPGKVREKIETGLKLIVGEKSNVVPYIGSLYALDYPEAEAVSPEFWKSRLQDAIQAAPV